MSSEVPPPSSITDRIPTWRYLKSYLVDSMDEQRIQRLQQCRILQDVLAECQSRQKSDSSDQPPAADGRSRWSSIIRPFRTPTEAAELEHTSPPPRRQLEDFPEGIRMLRYFGWRNRIVNDENQDRDSYGIAGVVPSNKSSSNDDPCAREVHAVWACRAVALQCGSHLQQLKSCFDQHDEKPNANHVLSTSETAYDCSSSITTAIPCADQQQQLGHCVRIAAQELMKRQNDRNKQ
jgi:hypothetical protein